MTRPVRKPRQLGLAFRTWGGRRPGAGRKPTRPGSVPHRRRPPLASRFPVHLALKIDPSLPGLRGVELSRVVTACLREGRQREGFRLVHYCIQPHHLHLIVEASSTRALSGGVQGLTIRVAKRINRALGRKGRVFVDRYFERVLKSPREVHHCLRYVLLNDARHTAQRGTVGLVGGIDPCSSGRYFDGWRGGLPVLPPGPGESEEPEEPPVTAARTYLLRRAWRRHGLLALDEIPGIRRCQPCRRCQPVS